MEIDWQWLNAVRYITTTVKVKFGNNLSRCTDANSKIEAVAVECVAMLLIGGIIL